MCGSGGGCVGTVGVCVCERARESIFAEEVNPWQLGLEGLCRQHISNSSVKVCPLLAFPIPPQR